MTEGLYEKTHSSAAAAAAVFISGSSAADSSIFSLSGDSSRMFYNASASESDFSGSRLSPDEIAETGRISSRFGYGTAMQILDSRISLEAQWKSRLTNYSSGESSYEVRDIAGGIEIENFGQVTFGEQEGSVLGNHRLHRSCDLIGVRNRPY